jgi:hypothetical protein
MLQEQVVLALRIKPLRAEGIPRLRLGMAKFFSARVNRHSEQSEESPPV